MDRTIALITRALVSDAYRGHGSPQHAPAIARAPQPATGGVLGFDFHLGGSEPQLIEINTNPGGLLVSLELARAATACCDCLAEPLCGDVCCRGAARCGRPARDRRRRSAPNGPRARATLPLRTIAIVDDDPAGQYLLSGVPAVPAAVRAGRTGASLIADAADASTIERRRAARSGASGSTWSTTAAPTSTSTEERHAALRDAYERSLAVHHTASGRACPLGRQAAAGLAARRVAAAPRPASTTAERAHLLATIPHTEIVEAAHAATISGRRRKDLFFKPVDGFGGKAAYRGDKLTRTTFEHILAHRYVAQAVAPTSSRRVPLADGEEADLRVDVRNYAACDGETWLRAARLYRGQTTNFRTAGGGFAPVLTVPDSTER